MCAGSLEISGDKTKITVSGQPQVKTDGDGPIADGAAVSIINREGYKDLGTVNIESGTFNSAADVEAVKAYSFNNANKTEDEWAEAGDTVNVKGGSFSSYIAENIVKSDMKATVTSGGETTVVIGKQAVENAIAELKAGDKIEFQSVADDTDVKIPEGVEVTNSTGSDMTINNVTVADGVTAVVKEPEPTDPSEPVNPENPQDKPSTDKPTTGDQEQTTGDKADADKESDSPKTGDDTMVLGYVIMMLAALGIGGTLVVNRKKN